MKKYLCLLLLVAACAPAHAQSAWLPPDEPNVASLELMRISLREYHGMKPSLDGHLAAFLTVRHAVGQRFRAVAELPFSYTDWLETDAVGTQNAKGSSIFGNVYVGAELHFPLAREAGDAFVEAGVRLPTMAQPTLGRAWAGAIGEMAANDRIEAFAFNYTTYQLLGNVVVQPDKALSIRLRGGPIYATRTGDEDEYAGSLSAPEGKDEVSLLYAAEAWLRAPLVEAAFGLTGRFMTTQRGSFGDNSGHRLRAQVSRSFSGVRPTVFLDVPIDDGQDRFLAFVYGLSLGVKLP